MKKIYEIYCKIQEMIVGTVFVSIVVLIFSAAFFRQFNKPIVWADDIAKFLFSWAAFLGADVAMRHSRLVGVDMLVKKFNPKIAKIVQIAVFSIIIALLAAFVVQGIKLSIESVDRSFQTLSRFSYSFVTVSLPVSSAMMILTACIKIGKIITHFREDDYNVLRDNPGDEEIPEKSCC
ncbi:MAG: TRAP transporter small permease [Spirochaetales bacterium]|nr:TRAP transporter small permease [Spirochaetales bacterium]